jgi:hypothetical protein
MTTDPRDPLQAAWSNQSDSGGEVDLDRARTVLRQREAEMRNRDRITYACAAIIAPSWALAMWFMPDLRLVAAVGFAVAVWLPAQMYARSAARLTPFSPGVSCTEYQVQLLSRERDLYQAMPKWYLIPVSLSHAAILIGLFTSPRFPQTSGLVLGAALMTGTAAAVLLRAVMQWRRLAVDLQRELDTLNMLRGSDSALTTRG